MIYLDTSVVLAQLLAEDRVPPPELWRETLVSSRLIPHRLSRARPAGAGRALEPFPIPVPTLDALHLASM